MTHLLEICAADIDSVHAAADGGADRVELCSALSEGGITPSFGFIKEALTVSDININVLIRPRGGDFIYSPAETDIMLADIEQARSIGVHGFVIGALDSAGNIDIKLCSRLIQAAAGLPVTFHRAFDLCRDPQMALEQIIQLGCCRLLTSGLAPSAEKGIPMLASLVRQAHGRISIMAGSGVSHTNSLKILTESGANELHASARESIDSIAGFRRHKVSMGAPDSDEYSRMTTSAQLVKKLSDIVHNYHT